VLEAKGCDEPTDGFAFTVEELNSTSSSYVKSSLYVSSSLVAVILLSIVDPAPAKLVRRLAEI